jgi:hypothetical protein
MFRALDFSRNEDFAMAKPTTQQIKLVSTADTGYFYVAKKNPRTKTGPDAQLRAKNERPPPRGRFRFSRVYLPYPLALAAGSAWDPWSTSGE